MELTRIRDFENQRTIYELIIDDVECVEPHYNNIDRLLINECEKSDKVSDKLLVLEMVTRKIENSQRGG